MKKKQFAVAALSLFTAAVLMTGCEGGGSGTTAAQDTTSAETTVTAETAVTAETSSAAASAETSGPAEKPEEAVGSEEKAKPGVAPPAGMEGKTGPGGTGGMTSKPESYAAVVDISEDTRIRDNTINSEAKDENAVLVRNGAVADLFANDIYRVSGDSTGGDAASFYGVGAAVLAADGTAYVDTCDISTDSAGGAGIFAYDKGTVYVRTADIDTKQNCSGGLHAAGGGKLCAWECDVTTSGESSAAIRSDRGGGVMVIEDGNYSSSGSGSPAVYSTADITAAYATLGAQNAEAACIEGRNVLRLYNCNLTGNMPDQEINNGLAWNVILYQSMSGDAEEGTAEFQMINGILESENGGMFYTTNTDSDILLRHVDLRCAENAQYFLRSAGNRNGRGWGKEGENGANCRFTALDQEIQGDIQWDSVSSLKFYLMNGSILEGSVVQDESEAGKGGDGFSEMFIDKDSFWYVRDNSTVTKLHCAGVIEDTSGHSVTIKKADGTVLEQGTSDLSITVEEYDKAPDLSGAGTYYDYSRYAVQKPELFR